MKKIIVSLCLAFGLSGLLSFHSLAFESSYEGTIKMKKPFRAWQGVGANGKSVYVTTDRSEKFSLLNTISVYDLEGNFIKELKEHIPVRIPIIGLCRLEIVMFLVIFYMPLSIILIQHHQKMSELVE